MTLDQIGNFHGTFGPKTEAAVGAFQQHLGLTATGKFGDVERKALEDIQSGIAKGNSNTQVIKAIQTRLVESGLMTQKQVNTGSGIFGGQTEAAVKQFQSSNKLSASGVVEAKTFRALIQSDRDQHADERVRRFHRARRRAFYGGERNPDDRWLTGEGRQPRESLFRDNRQRA